MNVPPRKRASWRTKALIAGLTIAVALGLFEPICRWRERTGLSYNPTWLAGGDDTRASDDHRFRSLGGRPIYSGLDPRKGRILLLGDSFAYSAYVIIPHSFAVYLQRVLNGGRLIGPYEVVNTGGVGHGMKTHYEIYAEVSAKIPHDHVVLICGWNDIRDTYAEVYNPQPAVVRVDNMLRRLANRSAALRFLLRLIDARYQRGRDAVSDFEKGRAAYESYFRRLAEAVRERGAVLHVVVVDPDPDSRAVFRDLCRRLSLDHYAQTFSTNFLDAYRLPDGHFNRKGNEKLAQEVARLFSFRRSRHRAAATGAARPGRR